MEIGQHVVAQVEGELVEMVRDKIGIKYVISSKNGDLSFVRNPASIKEDSNV